MGHLVGDRRHIATGAHARDAVQRADNMLHAAFQDARARRFTVRAPTSPREVARLQPLLDHQLDRELPGLHVIASGLPGD